MNHLNTDKMNNLTTLIYLKSRKNIKGESPIYLRVTVDGKRKEVSLNQIILVICI